VCHGDKRALTGTAMRQAIWARVRRRSTSSPIGHANQQHQVKHSSRSLARLAWAGMIALGAPSAAGYPAGQSTAGL
jgi:hypothetical protein